LPRLQHAPAGGTGVSTGSTWRRAAVSSDGTHHVLDGEPMYAARFDLVLKFHEPGLAPARDRSGAFHIRPDAAAAYPARYVRTFGFYEGLAAVEAHDGWLHVQPDGSPLCETRHAWCGNYQEGRCTVRAADGGPYHVDTTGRPAYADRWRYAGDYRDGLAVVQRSDGRSTHVDRAGRPIHGRWFEDLDVFHKALARARDARGWTHVDCRGEPVYSRRFAMVEPFYNDHARVERSDGGLEVIDPTGRAVVALRGPRRSELQALSGDMVGLWRTHAVAAVVAVGLVDALPGDPEAVAARTGLASSAARRLLRAAWELALVEPEPGGATWRPTARGALLAGGGGLDAAAGMWASRRADAWRGLSERLRSGDTAATGYFEELDGGEVEQHQAAYAAYAAEDYKPLARAVDWSRHGRLLDVAGGRGTLLVGLLSSHAHLRGTLLERPEVVACASVPERLERRIEVVCGDIFDPWPVGADAIVLARVLHDWPTPRAVRILKGARAALAPGGRVYVLELLLDESSPRGGLLDLNMLVLTGGEERSLAELASVARSADLEVVRSEPLSEVVDLTVLRAS